MNDLIISDLFFNLMDRMAESGMMESTDRKDISAMAGAFSKALSDIGIDVSPAKLRIDYFERI